MPSDDDKAKLRFEVANANFQSIGRAQGIYVTALLAYICLVWGLFFSGSSEVSLHLAWLDLKVDGVWRITPFVVLVLTLTYVGTVTAAAPAFAQLQAAQKEIFGAPEHSFFSLDTHKNITDYVAILQVIPWSKTRTPEDHGGSAPGILRRVPQLILPALLMGSAFTSYWAVYQLFRFGPQHRASLSFGASCLVLQVFFSVRPIWRSVRRFSGAKRTSDVYR